VPAVLPARLSPCRRWSPRPWLASRLAPALPSLAAPRASPYRYPATADGAVPVFDKEVAAAAFETRQLGFPDRSWSGSGSGEPSCLACRAAAAKTMAMAMAKAKFAAPPGADKVDDGSGSLLRSSGSATLSDRDLIGLLDAPPLGPSCSRPPPGPARSPSGPAPSSGPSSAADSGLDQLAFACHRKTQRKHSDECRARVQS
jgi:hypothetical protein